jgi:hypothetical protein
MRLSRLFRMILPCSRATTCCKPLWKPSKNTIQDKLTVSRVAENPETAPELTRIYLIYDQLDLDDIEPLEDYLDKQEEDYLDKQEIEIAMGLPLVPV